MRKIIPLLIMALTMMGCSSIDCPLNNTVYTKYKLEGTRTQLTADTLTIATRISTGEDSILLNRAENVDSFFLPISYSQAEDVLFFTVSDTLKRTFHDTVVVAKENHPHFESTDCSPSFFHTITSVTTTHHIIDSIKINNKEVTYDASKAHFHIYFGTRRW